MERRNNNKARSIGTINELSLVKAAAWAWYQHGSSKHMMQEYHDDNNNISSWKTNKPPRPSRYKLEAMKQVQENSENVSKLSCHVHVQNDPNSLLDSYEIRRISKDLDCYIEASHAQNCQNLRCSYKKLSSARSGTRSISHVRGKTESIIDHVSCKNKGKSEGGNSTTSGMSIKQNDTKSPRRFGFDVSRSTRICGARLDDVVDVKSRSGGSRWPEKHVEVVSFATCRPRRT